MNRDQIRAVFLNHGFTIKPGETDLKEYVFAAAEALIQEASKPKAKWFVFASTGCSCCNHENFLTGPFDSFEEAEEQAKNLYDSKATASQFSEHGRYTIFEDDCVQLGEEKFYVEGCETVLTDAPYARHRMAFCYGGSKDVLYEPK